MGQYEVGPYLDEIKDEIESYPKDILAIIAERKKNATAGSSSVNTHNEETLEPALPSANLLSTKKSAPSSGPSSSNPPDNNSALGK